MKKSTIVIVFGLFIVVTAFLGMSTEKRYQKEKHFESSNDILEQLEGKQLRAIDDKGRFCETNNVKECFSERKRLTNSQFNYGKIEIEKVEELSENQKQFILKDYDKLRNKFTKRRVITKEEPIRLETNVYQSYREQGKLNYSEPRKRIIDLVLVDEGEGLVIDYIMEYNPEQLKQEGNKDA